jgi:hypothetical protein
MPRDLEYERENAGYDWRNPGEDGIACKNYIVCETVLPSWWYSYKGHYLCANCVVMFGTWAEETGHVNAGKGELPVVEDVECPICLETGTGVTQPPRCDHHVCVACFKRCYYGPEPTEWPAFPYDEDVENQYLEDGIRSDEWYATYPLVLEYEAELDAREELYAQRSDTEEYLRCCPLCRK